MDKPTGFGQTPQAAPAVRGWSVFLGLLLIALGIVGAHETWVVASDTNAGSWFQPFFDVMANDNVETWMVWAGVAAIIVGLILLIAVFKPRRKTHTQIESDKASMWTRSVDIARRSSAIARDVPGVAGASTQAVGPKVTVTVEGDVDDAELKQRVEDSVNHALTETANNPQVTVKVQPQQEVGTSV